MFLGQISDSSSSFYDLISSSQHLTYIKVYYQCLYLLYFFDIHFCSSFAYDCCYMSGSFNVEICCLLCAVQLFLYVTSYLSQLSLATFWQLIGSDAQL